MNTNTDLRSGHTLLEIDKPSDTDIRLQSTNTYSSNIENKNGSETSKKLQFQDGLPLQLPNSEKDQLLGERKSNESLEHRGNFFLRVGSAAFYGIASLMIMVINKRILTVYAFPSFQVLGLGQMISTILILWVGRSFSIINFPNFSRSILTKIWPLPLYYAGNMIFGLAGTQALSLPMMIVLRRFTVLMTMVAEYFILKVKPELSVQLSVLMMIFGAFVAAINDLAFNLLGYSYILMNNICSCMNVVTTKKKLNAKDLGKYGLLFYNSLLMLPLTILLSYATGDIDKAYNYKGWTYANNNNDDSAFDNFNATDTTHRTEDNEQSFDITNVNIPFLFHFLLSCIFGFILMLATLLCTLYNTALTTMIIGSLKNILITYLGMVIGGDYIFSWWNFIGITISAVAALNYARITFTGKVNSNNKSNDTKLDSNVSR